MKFRTFKEFLESKEIKLKKDKGKIHMALDIEGEPVLVGGKKKKTSAPIKRVLDIGGEPETV